MPIGLSLAKNSTRVTDPSASDASADTVIAAGAVNSDPFGGLVIVTTGLWFDVGPVAPNTDTSHSE